MSARRARALDPHADDHRHPRGARVLGWLSRRARLAAPLAALGLLAPLAARAAGALDAPLVLAWGLDLAAHWAWAWLPAFALALPLAARGARGWWWLAPLAALPWLTATPAAPRAPVGEGGGVEAGASLLVATVNPHWRAADPVALAAWLQTLQPDLVWVVEASPRALAAERARWPHAVDGLRDGVDGWVLLSRHPVRQAFAIDDASGMPRLEAVLATPLGEVHVTGLHPLPPMTPALFAARDRVFAEAAAPPSLRAHGGGDARRIVLGDLNATPWAAGMRAFERAGLRRATGLAPTWPAPLARAGLGIPIDQVLVGPGWRVREAGRGPAVGGDHLGVWARLEVAPAR